MIQHKQYDQRMIQIRSVVSQCVVVYNVLYIYIKVTNLRKSLKMLSVFTSVESTHSVVDHFQNLIVHYLETREIPAFGGISLALRGSGASGAHFGNRRLRRR